MIMKKTHSACKVINMEDRLVDADFEEIVENVAMSVGEAIYNTAKWHYSFGTMPLHVMTDEAVREEIITRCVNRYGEDIGNVYIIYAYNALGKECIVKVDTKVVVTAKSNEHYKAAHNALKKLREQDAAEEENHER